MVTSDPNSSQSVEQLDLRYVYRTGRKPPLRPSIRTWHWGVMGLVIAGVVIWLAREPIASIEMLAPKPPQQSVLLRQLDTVLETEQTQITAAQPSANAPVAALANTIEAPEKTPDHRPPGPRLVPPTLSLDEIVRELGLDMDLTYQLVISIPPVTSSSTRLTQREEYVPPLSNRASAEPVLNKTETAEKRTEKIGWRWATIEDGDTLTAIFKRLGINPAIAVQLSHLPNGPLLNQLRPGPHLEVLFRNKILEALRYQHNQLRFVEVKRTGNTYVVQPIERQFDIVERKIEGTILSSLYSDGLQAGLDETVLYKLARIFRWQIDFTRDLQKGDRFAVIVNEQHLDGQKVSNGPIQAAAFNVKEKSYQALLHVGPSGVGRYYTPSGESLESVFLRSPLRFSRVTSHFSNNRYHPVLKKWRAHKGVDYGAPRGEPVMATAAGKVVQIGTKGAYGRLVTLQHGKTYQTVYAHLSRVAKGLRKSTSVKQGQVIGFVGSSGLATGPHLHYEFRVNGQHRNPLTVKLPRSSSIARKEKNAFSHKAKLWTARLETLSTKSVQ
jgi:murein DD-endopeptidase MepM/ murein hydrolase activator NlpD